MVTKNRMWKVAILTNPNGADGRFYSFELSAQFPRVAINRAILRLEERHPELRQEIYAASAERIAT